MGKAPYKKHQAALGALTSRKLMTYKLGSEIEREGYSVAPIHLVYKALGNFARRYEDEEVFQLANTLGVSRIVWGFAGYNYSFSSIGKPIFHKPIFHFSIISQADDDFSNKTPSDYKLWENIPLGIDNLPISTFVSKIPEVINFVGLSGQQNKHLFNYPYLEDLNIPQSPMELAKSAETNPIINAYYLQLMGILAPTYGSLEFRKDLFLRSLMPLWNADKKSPDYKLLMARAYLYLDRRPLALEVFGNPSTPEEKAFYDYLNASLPEQKEQIQQITSPLKRLIAELENYQLEFTYIEQKVEPDVEKFFNLVPSGWEYLIFNKLHDYSDWSRQSNILLKSLLDKEFPVDGLTMEVLYKAAVASGEIDKKVLSSSCFLLITSGKPF